MLRELIFQKPTDPVVVVIPIYKNELSKSERKSLDRCLEILINHPITIICPDQLKFDSNFFNNVDVKFQVFDKAYFKSVDTYSKLMLSTEFYKRFLNYKYILIYQLDAFVFRDELLEWCNKGFDYIGAPWMDEANYQSWSKDFSLLRKTLKRLNINFINYVGNGGFSLRNVKKCFLTLLLFNNKVSKFKHNEDIFWSYFVTSYLPFFRVADLQTALKFSFETCPEKCYILNQHQLPFGCHAWEKHNIDFWRKFLD